ncbi:MAG: hypothetical protein GW859_08440 [Sphingomonadales bacterium]|nr:hypothetical protein [Sphingomonadales bacterium]
MAGLMVAAASVALLASPAFSAGAGARDSASSLSEMVGQFTPATGDPRLVARFEKVSAAAKRNFRFTPVVARGADGSRAVTVVVRSRRGSLAQSNIAAQVGLTQPTREKAFAITPVAYDLGKSVGFTKFAIPDAGPGVDLATLPKAAELKGVSRRKSRFSTEVKLDSDIAARDSRPLASDDTVSVDVGAGYSLSRRLKVTAGVRLKQDNAGLAPIADDRRDSQAVYVGTRFKF